MHLDQRCSSAISPELIKSGYFPLTHSSSDRKCPRISFFKKGKRKVQGVPQSQTAALPRPQKKRKPTNLNKHKTNKRTKTTKISSLFPKRGNRNTKRTEKHKNKTTHGTTYNKSPRRINHKTTKSKTNTGTTALERSVERTTVGFKALLQLANFTLGPDATLNRNK